MVKLLEALRNPARVAQRARDRILYRRSGQSYVALHANRSDSENGLYLQAVEEALASWDKFDAFKADPRYREVLEHVSQGQGQQYLDILKEEAPDFLEPPMIDAFKRNDLVGSPLRSDYGASIGLISPTTLRYMKVASDIRSWFGLSSASRIVEIGCGYGGQLLTLDVLGAFYLYVVLDLPPVLDLTSRYLEAQVLNGSYETVTLNRVESDRSFDLAISNYAFSELPMHIQSAYIEKVLSRVERGYLTMNSGQVDGRERGGHPRLTLSQLRELLPELVVREERPATGEGNYIITWGESLDTQEGS